MEATLKCSIIDETSGEKIPARVSIKDMKDKYYTGDGCFVYGINTPPEWPSDWGIKGVKKYFYADGKFILKVPADILLEIQVSHGPEYEDYNRKIKTISGETELCINIKKLIDMPSEGYFSGDTHSHITHLPKDYHLTPQDGLFLAKAEGLHIASYLDTSYIGKDIVQKIHQVHFGIEVNHYPFLNFKDNHLEEATVFMGHPLFTNHLFSGLFTTDFHTAFMCHYELPISIALGKVSAIELQNNRLSILKTFLCIWYKLLNCGFRIPVSAGTDTILSTRTTLPVGIHRIYVKSGSADYSCWLEAVKKGKGFITDGPLLFLKINGVEPGDTIHIKKGKPVEIAISGISKYPVNSMEIIINGKVVRSYKLTSKKIFTKNFSLKIHKSCWIAARIIQEGDKSSKNISVFAHTNPVYVIVNRTRIYSSKDALFFLKWIAYYRKFRMKKKIAKTQKDEIKRARRIYISQLSSVDKKNLLKTERKTRRLTLTMFKEWGRNLIKTGDEKNPQKYWKGKDHIFLGDATGEQFLRIIRKKSDIYDITMCHQDVMVKPKSYYILSAEIRSPIIEDAEKQGGVISSTIIAFNQKGEYLGQIGFERIDNIWRKGSVLLYTSGETKKIMVCCITYTEGMVDFRRIQIKRCIGPFLNLG